MTKLTPPQKKAIQTHLPAFKACLATGNPYFDAIVSCDELDVLIAHLYRLSRDDLRHILTTFALVFPNDEHGHAKKQALLATYQSCMYPGTML